MVGIQGCFYKIRSKYKILLRKRESITKDQTKMTKINLDFPLPLLLAVVATAFTDENNPAARSPSILATSLPFSASCASLNIESSSLGCLTSLLPLVYFSIAFLVDWLAGVPSVCVFMGGQSCMLACVIPFLTVCPASYLFVLFHVCLPIYFFQQLHTPCLLAYQPAYSCIPFSIPAH